jgi:hypothetical protein
MQPESPEEDLEFQQNCVKSTPKREDDCVNWISRAVLEKTINVKLWRMISTLHKDYDRGG